MDSALTNFGPKCPGRPNAASSWEPRALTSRVQAAAARVERRAHEALDRRLGASWRQGRMPPGPASGGTASGGHGDDRRGHERANLKGRQLERCRQPVAPTPETDSPTAIPGDSLRYSAPRSTTPRTAGAAGSSAGGQVTAGGPPSADEHAGRARYNSRPGAKRRLPQAKISGIVLLVLSQLPQVSTSRPMTCWSVSTSSVTLRPGTRTWRLPGSLPPAWPINTTW